MAAVQLLSLLTNCDGVLECVLATSLFVNPATRKSTGAHFSCMLLNTTNLQKFKVLVQVCCTQTILINDLPFFESTPLLQRFFGSLIDKLYHILCVGLQASKGSNINIAIKMSFESVLNGQHAVPLALPVALTTAFA